MKQIVVFTLFFLFSFNAFSQMTGQELLGKSIKYHDPKGKWEKAKLTFDQLKFKANLSDFLKANHNNFCEAGTLSSE